MPCNICRKCLRVLTAAYKLKLLAKESNRQLLLSLSSHSFKGKEEDKIKEEIPPTGYTAFENEIKEEEPGGDYTTRGAEANEETDVWRDFEPHCSEDGTRWDEEAPSALPAPSRGVVQSIGSKYLRMLIIVT